MKPDALFTALLRLYSLTWRLGIPVLRTHPRIKQGLKQRMAPETLPRADIWIQAASAGEAYLAVNIINRLKPRTNLKILLTATTVQGLDILKKSSTRNHINKLIDLKTDWFPFDSPHIIKEAVKIINPSIMVLLETEIWPVWLFEAHRMGIKTALINGRISQRSIGRYLKLRPFFREVLRNFDVFSMILEQDAERIKAMGADPQKVEINGNAKHDFLGSIADPAMETEMRQILDLKPSRPVFVAGSTREGEEAMILDAYEKILKKFPDTILIIAPRHIERTPVIESLIQRRGFRYQLRTDIGKGKAKLDKNAYKTKKT